MFDHLRFPPLGWYWSTGRNVGTFAGFVIVERNRIQEYYRNDQRDVHDGFRFLRDGPYVTFRGVDRHPFREGRPEFPRGAP